MTSRAYFQGKRIAVIGLGPQGEMLADIKFLIKAGALVAVYDMRSEARIKDDILFLRSIGLANYVCGSVPADDLLDMDMIILSHEYPRESSFLNPAKDKKVSIEYPETLFFKLAPPLTVVGIMGICGKATVVSLVTPLLEAVCEKEDAQGLFIIDPESAGGVLSHLKRAKNGDIVIIRIIETMMKELHDMHISPQIAVFTTFPDKSCYTGSPFEILDHQTYNNFVIASDEVIDRTHSFNFQPKGKMLRTKASIVPADWGFVGKGDHDLYNAALALQAARLFKISDEAAHHIFKQWKALKGRLELVKKVKNVEFYNDTASISPYSTQAAIKALSQGRNIVLVFGGADSGSDYRELYAILPQYVHTVILLPGSGTMKQRAVIQKIDHIEILSAPSVEEAARLALEHSRKGDRVVFSPGFEALGIDRSRKERGERFVRAVRTL